MNPVAAVITVVGVLLIGLMTVYFQIKTARDQHAERWMHSIRKALSKLVESLEQLRLRRISKLNSDTTEEELLAKILGNITSIRSLLNDTQRQQEIVKICEQMRQMADIPSNFVQYDALESRLITDIRGLLTEEFEKIKNSKQQYIIFAMTSIIITAMIVGGILYVTNKPIATTLNVNPVQEWPTNVNININRISDSCGILSVTRIIDSIICHSTANVNKHK